MGFMDIYGSCLISAIPTLLTSYGILSPSRTIMIFQGLGLPPKLETVIGFSSGVVRFLL